MFISPQPYWWISRAKGLLVNSYLVQEEITAPCGYVSARNLAASRQMNGNIPGNWRRRR